MEMRWRYYRCFVLLAVYFQIGCSDRIDSTGNSFTVFPAQMPVAFSGQIQITGAFRPIAIREMGCGASGFLIETSHDIYATRTTATGNETFLLCSGQLQLSSRTLSCGVTAEAQGRLTPGTTYDVNIRGENGSRYSIPEAFTVAAIASDSETDTELPPDTGNDTGSSTADTGSTADSVPDTSADTGTVVDSDTAAALSTDELDSGTAMEWSTDDSDYTVQVAYTGRTPDFNGQLETLWTLDETLDNEAGCDSGQIPDTIRFEILWDEIGLYFGVMVPDDTLVTAPGTNDDLRDFDAITIFIDVPPTRSAYNRNDNRFTFGPDAKLVQMRVNVPLLGWNVASNASGYSLELGIPWSSLDLTPERGLSFGFDILVHDIDQHSDNCFAFYRANGQEAIITTEFALLVLQ